MKTQNSFPMGLPNVGNTCFLNSIIQFLYAAQEIRRPLIQAYGEQKYLSDAKYSKLIGKIFFYLSEKSADFNRLKMIILKMAERLESINSQYKKNSQEDALQTLLNILLQIQEKHPNIIGPINVEYKACCSCHPYVTKQRVLSYSQSICVKCGKPVQKSFINKPKYILYSNAAGQMVRSLKTQNAQISNKNLCLRYRLIAQIIYIGNGRFGHYTARRFNLGLLYQFNDSTIKNISEQQLADRKALILLYELIQEQPSGFNIKSQPTRPNHRLLASDQRNANQQPVRQKESATRSSTCLKKDEDKMPMGLKSIGSRGLVNSIIQFLYAANQMRDALIQKYGSQQNMQGAKLGKLLGKIFCYLSTQSKDENKINDLLSAIASSTNILAKKNLSSILLTILLEVSEKHPEAVYMFDVQYKVSCGCSSTKVKNEKILSYAEEFCVKCHQKIQRVLNNQPEYIIFYNPSHLESKDSLSFELKNVVYSIKAQIIEGHRDYTIRREEGRKWYQFESEKVTIDRGKKSVEGGVILLYKRVQTATANNFHIQELEQTQEDEEKQSQKQTGVKRQQLESSQQRFCRTIQRKKALRGPTASNKAPVQQAQTVRLKVILDKVYLFRLWVIKDMMSNPLKYEQRNCFAKIVEKNKSFYFQLMNQANFPDFEGIHNFHQFFQSLTNLKLDNQLEQIGKFLQNHLDSCIRRKYNVGKIIECQRFNNRNQIAKNAKSYQGDFYQRYEVKEKMFPKETKSKR